MIICLYVDDIFFGTNLKEEEETKYFLSSKFSMKNIGEADVIHGIKIIRNNGGICLTQSRYVEKVLEMFNYHDCLPLTTPLGSTYKLI